MSGKTIELTKENFESEVLKSNLPVLIDFWAAWCGPCRILAPVLKEFAEEQSNKIKVAKVNVDENQELAVKYSIMSIPTLLFFKDGEIQKKLVGAVSKKNLETELAEWLK
ncbi:MAG: thioredoxin [Candidatus Subteraquimicrobiales bacterium]|nr:thioredoxin [Candidatus Subteraquimicrobiales bacterium]